MQQMPHLQLALHSQLYFSRQMIKYVSLFHHAIFCTESPGDHMQRSCLDAVITKIWYVMKYTSEAVNRNICYIVCIAMAWTNTSWTWASIRNIFSHIIIIYYVVALLKDMNDLNQFPRIYHWFIYRTSRASLSWSPKVHVENFALQWVE